MALLAITGTKARIAETLALSEHHYVLDRYLSFVSIETLVYLHERSEFLSAHLHAALLDSKKSSAVRHAFVQVERAIRRGDLNPWGLVEEEPGVLPTNGIFDFQNTWFWKIAANENFEGDVSHVQIDASNLIRVYGEQADVPALEVKRVSRFPVADGGRDSSVITRIDFLSPGGFERGRLYALRWGFFTPYHPAYRALTRKTARFLDRVSKWGYERLFRIYTGLKRVRFPYQIRTWRYSESARGVYEQRNLEDTVRTARLLTELPAEGLAPVMNLLRTRGEASTSSDLSGIYQGASRISHSNIWLMLPRGWRVRSSIKGVWQFRGRLQHALYGSQQLTQFDSYRLSLSQLSQGLDVGWIRSGVGPREELLRPQIHGLDWAALWARAISFLGLPAILLALMPSTWTTTLRLRVAGGVYAASLLLYWWLRRTPSED